VAPETQNEFLYTDEIELTDVDAASVTFWSLGYGSGQTGHGTVITLEVKVGSDDADGGEWDVVWTYPEPEWTIGSHWYDKTVDLSPYIGEKIFLGWRYTFDGVSADQGKLYSLDDILVTGNCTGCAISGLCYGDGTINPGNSCQMCDAAVSTAAWTPVNAGSSCDDGLFCTVEDECDDAGNCDGVARECDDGDFCTGVEFCYEAGDLCASPGDPCGDDETCNEDAATCDLPDDDDTPDDDDIVDDDAGDDDADDDDFCDDDPDDADDDDDAATDDDDDDDDDNNDEGCGC